MQSYALPGCTDVASCSSEEVVSSKGLHWATQEDCWTRNSCSQLQLGALTLIRDVGNERVEECTVSITKCLADAGPMSVLGSILVALTMLPTAIH